MEYYLNKAKQMVVSVIRFLEEYPLITIAIAGVMLFFCIINMRERQSSAGMWVVVIIAAVLIMWGLGCLTGMGFTMSF